MPDIIPYTAGVDMASAAGASMGRANAPSALGGFMKGFQPGFDTFVGDVREDRKRKEKLERNRASLADLEAQHPDLANDKAWWWVQGHVDAGGEPTDAIKQFMGFKQHEKDQAAQTELKQLMETNRENRTSIYGQDVESRKAERTARTATSAKLADSTISHRGDLIDLGRDRLDEQGVHNQTMEGIAQQNADRPRGKPSAQVDVDQAMFEDKIAGQHATDALKELQAVIEHPSSDKESQANALNAARAALVKARGMKKMTEDGVKAAHERLKAPAQQQSGGGTGDQDFKSYYDSLPSGAEFVHPDGTRRRKP